MFKRKVLRIGLMAMVFMFMGMGAVNAAPDMSKNVVGRQSCLHEWDMYLEDESWQINTIKDLQYQNFDSVLIMVPKALFLKEMAGERMIANLGYSYRATPAQLDAFINRAHDAGITVELVMYPTYLHATGENVLGYFGSNFDYNPKRKDGTPLLPLEGRYTYSYLDLNYPEARKLVIDVAKYAITHHDFDGIWWEEPGMYNNAFDGKSAAYLQWSWAQGYIDDGYGDPYAINNWTSEQILHMVQQKEKDMTLFFKEWHEALDALGPNYQYPYFWNEILVNWDNYDRTRMDGSWGCGDGVNITDIAAKGYIDRFISEKVAGYHTVEIGTKIMNNVIANTPNIYHSYVVYIRSAGCQGTPPYACSRGTYEFPLWPAHLANQATVGSSSEIIFAYGFTGDWDGMRYPTVDVDNNAANGVQSWCMYMFGMSYCSHHDVPINSGYRRDYPGKYLHDNPPKTPRTFNPIGKTAGPSAPTFSPSPLITYTSAPQNITIIPSVSGSVIHYTLDGSEPTLASPEYSSPISISSTTTIKAKAWKEGLTPSSIATAVYSIGALPQGIVQNPGFESGAAPWLFYTNGTGSFTASPPGNTGTNAIKISLSSAGTNIQLYQDGITLEPNTQYRLTFAAYSSTGHDLTVNLMGIPYTPYGLSYTPALTTSWQTFTKEFTSTGFTGTVNNGRLQFWLAPYAAAGDIYYIDDVKLEKVTASATTLLNLTIYQHGIGNSGDNTNPADTSLSNKNPVHPTINADLELFNTNNQLIGQGNGPLTYANTAGNYQGIIGISPNTLTSGNYYLKVKTPSHLKKLIPGILTIIAGQKNTVPPATLVTGDANNDNKLNILDYNLLLDCYSDLSVAVVCDADKKDAADFSDDSFVNQVDYNLFLREIATQPGQ